MELISNVGNFADPRNWFWHHNTSNNSHGPYLVVNAVIIFGTANTTTTIGAVHLQGNWAASSTVEEAVINVGIIRGLAVLLKDINNMVMVVSYNLEVQFVRYILETIEYLSEEVAPNIPLFKRDWPQ